MGNTSRNANVEIAASPRVTASLNVVTFLPEARLRISGSRTNRWATPRMCIGLPAGERVATTVAIGAHGPGHEESSCAGSFVIDPSADASGPCGQGWGTGGRRFKSGRPDHISRTNRPLWESPPGPQYGSDHSCRRYGHVLASTSSTPWLAPTTARSSSPPRTRSPRPRPSARTPSGARGPPGRP